MKGFNSKTLAIRLKELERNGIPHRQALNEIPATGGISIDDQITKSGKYIIVMESRFFVLLPEVILGYTNHPL